MRGLEVFRLAWMIRPIHYKSLGAVGLSDLLLLFYHLPCGARKLRAHRTSSLRRAAIECKGAVAHKQLATIDPSELSMRLRHPRDLLITVVREKLLRGG